MKNIVWMFTEPYTIEQQETEINEKSLGIEDVLLEYLCCAICGGDYSTYLGRRREYPVSLGHEFVAKVIRTGSSVTNVVKNDLVVSDFNFRCGECRHCQSGDSHLCLRNSNMLFSNRAFSDYGVVHFNYLTKIPASSKLPTEVFCLAEPLSCVLHACKIEKVEGFDSICIVGGGGIGMLFCFLLKKVYRTSRICVVEPNEDKSNKLKHCFHIQQCLQVDNKYDLIIECSNSPVGLMQALKITPRGGRICIMSHLYGLDTSFVYEQVCKKELRPSFPLRNGKKKNLEISVNLLNRFWKEEYNVLFDISSNLEEMFRTKNQSSKSKQIFKNKI